MGIIDVKLNDFIFVEHFWIFFIDFFLSLSSFVFIFGMEKVLWKEKKDNCFIIRDFNARLVFYVRSHDSNDEREREREISYAEWYRCMLCDIVYVVRGPFGWSLMEKKVRKIQ